MCGHTYTHSLQCSTLTDNKGRLKLSAGKPTIAGFLPQTIAYPCKQNIVTLLLHFFLFLEALIILLQNTSGICCGVRVIAEVRWHAKINKTSGLLLGSTVLAGATVTRVLSCVCQHTSTGSSRPSNAMCNFL